MHADFEDLQLNGQNGSAGWIKENCYKINSWQKAAEENDPRGQHPLALCYDFGLGVPEMIDDLVRDIPGSRQGARLCFSAAHSSDFTGSSNGFVRKWAATGSRPTNRLWKAGCVRLCFGTWRLYRLICISRLRP